MIAQMILFTKSSATDGLLLFVTSMAFHGLPSTTALQNTSLPGRCYQCVAFEGISNPQCEFPVARKARIVPCFSRATDAIRTTCAKLVVFSKGHKDGQTLKSWLMKRECMYPRKIKDRYDNLVLDCNTCGKVQNSVRIFQRYGQQIKGGYPRTMLPEEQEQLIVVMCVCCEDVCNAEEGFNLTYLDANDSGFLFSRRNYYYLMILLSVYYILYFC